MSSICIGTEAPTQANAEVQATEKYVTRILKDADADVDISKHAGSMLAFKTLKSLPRKESGVKDNDNIVPMHHYKGLSSSYVAHSDNKEPVTKRNKSEPAVRSYDMASEHGEEEIANRREYVSYTKYGGERSATSYRDDRVGRDLPSKRHDPRNHQNTNKSPSNDDGSAAGDKTNEFERVTDTPPPKDDAEAERSQLSDGKHSAEEQQYDSGEAGEGANHSPLAESPAPPAKVSEYDEKIAEEPLNELLSSTMSLYPESRLVIGLAMLGILWVIAIIVLSAAGHAHKLLFPDAPTHDFIAGTTESSYTVPYPTSTTEVTMPTTTTHPNTPGSKVYICSTPFCEREGTYLKSLLSSQNNPCDNFYDYVCDIWKANARPTVGLGFGTAVSRDTLIEEEMESEVIEYLRRGSRDVLLALQLFRACLRSTKLQGTEVKMALKDMFKDLIAATWPVAPTDTSFSSSHVWTLAGTLYRQFGIDAFLGVSIGRHQRNHLPVVLEPPRMLFLKHYEAYSMTLSMFQDAIREALTLSSTPDIAHEVANDVYTVLSDLAERQSAEGEFNFRISKPDDLPKGLRTFLSAVFEGRLNKRAIVVRNPEYTFKQLEDHVKSNDIPSLINYMGFRLVIRMAPFLPASGFENLKMIFSAETTGRVRSLALHQNYLCLRAVEMALPVCVVKAHAKVHMASGNDLNDRVWLSQVESSFFRNVAQLSWVDDLSYMIIRFKMANTKLARFFPGWSLDMDQCNRQHRRLRQRYSTGLPLAVRFFHGLVPLLRQEPTALGASYNLQYTNHSQTLFRNFLNCLSRDLSTVLRQTRSEFDLDPDDASYALLAQTVAVALTFITFHELLHVERVWKLSFRLSTLPDLSSDQLFFVWFALDNCENSDPTYQIRQYQWWKRLPPDFAVNFPLRHLPNSFGEAFNCPSGSFMRPGYRETCNIFNTTANYVLH
ncbi:hypothetical protein HPB51_010883 [Rhipicephalus microplus]|uniref:M13 family peptidase n=1 Tax=Rhipicephalus microplus TaxID=6941 RepID=A0A9J6DM85_RHIMP|nr:hypothetical protein HPB51_010883 [Rhipicephalus microplus]